jgi:hypothetical protein
MDGSDVAGRAAFAAARAVLICLSKLRASALHCADRLAFGVRCADSNRRAAVAIKTSSLADRSPSSAASASAIAAVRTLIEEPPSGLPLMPGWKTIGRRLRCECCALGVTPSPPLRPLYLLRPRLCKEKLPDIAPIICLPAAFVDATGLQPTFRKPLRHKGFWHTARIPYPRKTSRSRPGFLRLPVCVRGVLAVRRAGADRPLWCWCGRATRRCLYLFVVFVIGACLPVAVIRARATRPVARARSSVHR